MEYRVKITALQQDQMDPETIFEVCSEVECDSIFEAGLEALRLIRRYEQERDVLYITSVKIN